MKKLIENNLNQLRIAGLIVITLVVITVFCFLTDFPLIIPLLLLVIGIHLHFIKKASIKMFINLGLLLTLIVFAAEAIIKYTTLSSYYIPVASVGMLVVLLYSDVQLAFLMSFISSVVVGLVVGVDFELMLTMFVGSSLAVYFVKDARTRGELIQAGFFVGIVQVIAFILLRPSLDFILSKNFLLNYFRPLLINGFIVTSVVIVTSKIFESLFGVLTNFSLLELSDFNQPLLKRMVIEAPGTYHHSLIVSNLAETAADSIGANALLCRVGAYYHDVGKMVKPGYFTENQLMNANKHDRLEPSISKLVILNHVKEGLAIAKKYKLNPIIAKFIPEHHGTGIIYYFYRKALSEAEKDERVDEETYRYPGPKPQSRETAVVLMADSVEGAVRAMDEPTPSRIDEVVRKVINNKFIDGQLDECNITLKEIEVICATFTRVLSAMYHSRIKYPEKRDDNGNNNKKSTEKNSSKAQPDQDNSSEDSKA